MRFAARLNLLATLAGMVWPAHAAFVWTASSVQRALVQGGVVVVVGRPGRGAVDAVVVEEVVAGVVVVDDRGNGGVVVGGVVVVVGGWVVVVVVVTLVVGWGAG